MLDGHKTNACVYQIRKQHKDAREVNQLIL